MAKKSQSSSNNIIYSILSAIFMRNKDSQSSSNRILVSILSAIFMIAIALIAQQMGLDVLGTEQAEEPVTADTFEGEWYSLYFNDVIETDDETQHVGSPIEAAMVEAINSATTSIDGALYELDLERVPQALIDARARGVRVRLVLDDEDAVYDDHSTVFMLTDPAVGMVVYCEDEQPAQYDIRCDDRSDLMHNKFLIIDGYQVWMGSMNFTHNGVYNNNNNAILIRSRRLAENYQAIFDLMFEEGEFNLLRVDQNDIPHRQLTINGVPVQTYFSPDDANILVAEIIRLVNEADTSIRVMTFNITLPEIGDAIIAKHNAGVDVKAVIEARLSTTRNGQYYPFICEGIPARTDGNRGYALHHKVIIIDNEIVITGSFNFSENAKSNSENVLIIHSPEVAQQFTAEFDERYGDPRAETASRNEAGCN